MLVITHIPKLSKGFIFSVGSSFLWACSIINNRFLLLEGENPLNLALWIGIFVTIPWLFLLFKRRDEYFKLAPRYKWLLVTIGIASSIGIQYLQSLALANTSATNFAFLYRTIIIFTIVFAAVFLKEKITRSKWLLATLILIGTYLLASNGQQIVLTKGDVYTLLMSASAALIANVLIKHTISKMHPDLSGAVTQIIATISLLVLAISMGVLQLPHNYGLIIIGSIISFMAVALRNRAYQHASASFVSMLFSLTPLFVTVLSYPLLHERLSGIEIAGGIIIIGATFATEKLKI